MSLSTTIDDFISNYIEGTPRWEVVLNNGERIYRDDGRNNIKPHSAWIRLKTYCNEKNLYITNMLIGFRDHIYHLPANADGYYFSLGARGGFGLPKTMQLFFAGTLQNDVLEVTCWKVPEMLKEETTIRDINGSQECLITKNIHQYMAR